MKKTFAFLALAAAVFVVVSPGSAGVRSCGSSAVTGSPVVAYAAGGYVVTGITVSGLVPACGRHTIAVTLTGRHGRALLANVSGLVPAGGGRVTLRAPHSVAASAVSGVSVALDG